MGIVGEVQCPSHGHVTTIPFDFTILYCVRLHAHMLVNLDAYGGQRLPWVFALHVV